MLNDSAFQRNVSGKSGVMLNLFSLKEKKEAEDRGGGRPKKGRSAAQLRITKVTLSPPSPDLT